MARLFRKKSETRKSFWRRAVDLALTDVRVLAKGVDAESLESLEERLIRADFGVPATLRLVDSVERAARRGKARGGDAIRAALEEEIRAILESGPEQGANGALPGRGGSAPSSRAPAAPGTRPRAAEPSGPSGPGAGSHPTEPDEPGALAAAETGPTVYLIVGVNGVGKTTSIAKLAHQLQSEGRSVLLAAADTYRAGATEQLRIWADRLGVDLVAGQGGGDPAAVAYDAIEAAAARGIDVVIVDTAGRLHTDRNLMEELSKVERVIGRKIEGAPHETLIVLDATVGQNALRQVRTFQEAVELTGILLAKMDSTGKGGIVVALREELGLPVKLVGTGEGLDDLGPFDVEAFIDGIFDR